MSNVDLTKLPAMNPELWDINSLFPYEQNAQQHDAQQVMEIASSIQSFGFTKPLLVSPAGEIIAGEGAWLALKHLRYTKAPVIIAKDWTDEQVRIYRLADNQLTKKAEFDLNILRVELGELSELGADLGLTGFSEEFINEMLLDKSPGNTDRDTVTEPVINPISVRGDVWLLGEHVLMCGDSTSPEDVAALLGKVKPHLMATDPPYGVNYDPSWREAQLVGGARSLGMVSNDDRADWTAAWELFPGAVAYVWHAGLHSGEVLDSLQRAGFTVRSQIIWTKQHFTLSRGDYHWQHEPCWYAVKKNHKGWWAGDRKQTTVWAIDSLNPTGRGKEEASDLRTGHGTQKPVECMKRPIENNSSVGHAVYEPFCGSGTTIIAAEITGRHCYSMEIDAGYVDAAIIRWQDFTGQKAVHKPTGKTFELLRGERDGGAEDKAGNEKGPDQAGSSKEEGSNKASSKRSDKPAAKRSPRKSAAKKQANRTG